MRRWKMVSAAAFLAMSLAGSGVVGMAEGSAADTAAVAGDAVGGNEIEQPMTGGVYKEFPVNYVAQQIADPSVQSISVELRHHVWGSHCVPADTLQKLKDSGKTLSVKVNAAEDFPPYYWVFDGSQIQTVMDVVLDANINRGSGEAGIPDTVNSVVLDFGHAGALPEGTVFKTRALDTDRNGTGFFYFYDEANGSMEYGGEVSFAPETECWGDINSYMNVVLKRCAKVVVTDTKLTGDHITEPTEPSTEPETEPETPAETEPETPVETEPETPAETEPSTEPETEPETPAETEPSTEPGEDTIFLEFPSEYVKEELEDPSVSEVQITCGAISPSQDYIMPAETVQQLKDSQKKLTVQFLGAESQPTFYWIFDGAEIQTVTEINLDVLFATAGSNMGDWTPTEEDTMAVKFEHSGVLPEGTRIKTYDFIGSEKGYIYFCDEAENVLKYEGEAVFTMEPALWGDELTRYITIPVSHCSQYLVTARMLEGDHVVYPSEPETPAETEPEGSEPETPAGTKPGETEPETPAGTKPGETEPETPAGTNPAESEPGTSAMTNSEETKTEDETKDNAAADTGDPLSMAIFAAGFVGSGVVGAYVLGSKKRGRR